MLPTTELSDFDFQYTILHELTHHRRRDMFYKWLVQVTICLHWFNPFVYLMSREVNHSCELSCDEAVIKSLKPEERQAYGDTLLNAMGIGGIYNLVYGSNFDCSCSCLLLWGNGGKTRWNLCLVRVKSPDVEETARSVTITIPYGMNLKTVMVVTNSGNINLEECTASMFMMVRTQSGHVLINDGSAQGLFMVKTKSGTALISGTILPVQGVEHSSAIFYTENGSLMFQPAGSVWDYRYRLDTGEDAQIFVNGKQYQGGDGNINGFSRSQIDVDISRDGTLIVQDLSLGKLSIDKEAVQSNQTASSPAADNGNLTLITKEYTESDLQQMGVTGLRIEAITENIVINQGGTSTNQAIRIIP